MSGSSRETFGPTYKFKIIIIIEDEAELERTEKYSDLLFQLKQTYPECKSLIFIPLIIGVCGGIKPTVTD